MDILCLRNAIKPKHILKIMVRSLVFSVILLLLTFSPSQADFNPAILTSVSDSLGNVNTNSWSEDGSGDWSCSPGCPDLSLNVGESITLTAAATDPNDLPLEYRFSLQPSSGNFDVLQDWSSSNVFVWDVLPEHAGPWIVLMVSVRNNDSQDWQGSFAGDDYSYATYEVFFPIYLPAVIQ
jgi:hypothetical protein